MIISWLLRITWIKSLRAEQDFFALHCERGYNYMKDIPTLDVVNAATVLPGQSSAVVTVVAPQQLCYDAVLAACGAPVNLKGIISCSVQLDARRAARACVKKTHTNEI